MKNYVISQDRTGVVFGHWAAESAIEAYQKMMRDAGYDTAKDADIPNDIQVIPCD